MRRPLSARLACFQRSGLNEHEEGDACKADVLAADKHMTIQNASPHSGARRNTIFALPLERHGIGQVDGLFVRPDGLAQLAPQDNLKWRVNGDMVFFVRVGRA